MKFANKQFLNNFQEDIAKSKLLKSYKFKEGQWSYLCRKKQSYFEYDSNLMSLPILSPVEDDDATHLTIKNILNQEPNYFDGKTFEREIEGREKQYFQVKLTDIASEEN